MILTPDGAPPALLSEFADARLVWASFEALSQAIAQLLDDPSEPASEQQRLLLRELVNLFELDGLVASDEVAVVAASAAYRIWQDHGAYVCQANRAFRNVAHWGFYRDKHIEPEFPRVLAHWNEVDFDWATAREWQHSSDPLKARAGEVTAAMLSSGLQDEGVQRAVYLLQPPDDPQLARRQGPLPHRRRSAWTQHQRYARLEQLLTADSTEELLS